MRDNLHPDAQQILERLHREKITALYHFTSVENLSLIRQTRALCSKQTLEDLSLWPPPAPGGNDLSHELDRRNGNWDKVSLNFTPHTPMAYRKKPSSHLCFFVLDVALASFAATVFTDTNAASTGGQQRGEGLQGLGLVNFAAIRSKPRGYDRGGWVRPVQAEILIPNRIPLNYIKEVLFVSDASVTEGRKMWGTHPAPTFRVEPRCFSDNPAPFSLTHNFPFLANILLTDRKITNLSEAQRERAHKDQFVRTPSAWITAIAHVNAIAGTNAQVTWRPGSHVAATEFGKTSEYFHWPGISVDKLPDGNCSMEYKINGIRWATIEFNIAPK